MTRESKAIEVLMNWAEDRVSPEGVSKDDMVEKAFRAGQSYARSQAESIIRREMADVQPLVNAERTPYYIDYIHDKGITTEPYFQLVRRRDEAILYANANLDFVKLRCWELGISKDDIVIL